MLIHLSVDWSCTNKYDPLRAPGVICAGRHLRAVPHLLLLNQFYSDPVALLVLMLLDVLVLTPFLLNVLHQSIPVLGSLLIGGACRPCFWSAANPAAVAVAVAVVNFVAVPVANSVAVAVAELIAKHRLSGTTQPAQRPLWRIYLYKQQLWHAKTNSRKESSDFSSIVGFGRKAIETKLLHSALHPTCLFWESLQNLPLPFSDKIKLTNIAQEECYLVPAYFILIILRWWTFWGAWC